MNRVREMVDKGFNIAFFPEGGIKSTKPPQMVRFQDGAFRLSVEKNMPILPVTLPTNYEILPDDGNFLVHRRKMKLVVHEPVFPQGNDEKEMIRLKKTTYEIIQKELNRQHGID